MKPLNPQASVTKLRRFTAAAVAEVQAKARLADIRREAKVQKARAEMAALRARHSSH